MIRTKTHKIIVYLGHQMIPIIGTVLLVTLMLYVYNSAQASPQTPTGQVTSNASSGLITYQGMLTDKNGQLIRGKVDITFRIYDTPTSGIALWSEAHSGTANGVQVTDGIFNVILGSLNPFSPTVWASTPRYLGVQVGGDSEMLPRAPINDVPPLRNAPNVLGSVNCDNCGNVTETFSEPMWTPIKGGSTNELIQVSVTTTGRPISITLNAMYSSQSYVDKWCAVRVLRNGQIYRFLNGDGSHAMTDQFGCSSSFLLTDLPSGDYAFQAVAWIQPAGGAITWIYQRQIAVVEY
jgi:hypothetical protein